MRYAKAVIVTTTLLAGCHNSVITAQVGPSYDALGVQLERIRGDLQIPGMSAALIEAGRITWSRGFGVTDIAINTAVTTTTSFHAASLTKALATVIVLRLVERGVISLDDPISKYGLNLPSSGVIRIRHLLSMTSQGTPGEAFSYNGGRFGLLSAVIRAATGTTFAQLVVDSIVRPTGMVNSAPNLGNHAAFRASGLDSAAFALNLAKPYALQSGRVVGASYPGYFGPAAGLMASSEDLARFAGALLEGALLSPASQQLMFTPTVNSRGAILPYALGLFSQTYNGERVVWAYGYWVGNSSLLVILPDRRIAFVLMANTDQLSARYPLGAGQLLESPAARLFLGWAAR